MSQTVGMLLANPGICPPPFGRTESSNDGVRGKTGWLGQPERHMTPQSFVLAAFLFVFIG
jgi:hypothetical protein